jgi:hypothetical protein
VIAARCLALNQQQQQQQQQRHRGSAAALITPAYAALVHILLTVWHTAFIKAGAYHGHEKMPQHPQWNLTVLPVAQLATAAIRLWPEQLIQPAAAATSAAADSRSSSSNSRQSAPHHGDQQQDHLQVPAAYDAVAAVANAVVIALPTGEQGGGSSSSWPQLLAAAPVEQVASLWQVLHVFLAWTVGAERRGVAEAAAADLTDTGKAAKKAIAGVPFYHQQYLAAVGAPAQYDVKADAAEVSDAVAAFWEQVKWWAAPIYNLLSSSSSHSSTSSSSRAAISRAAPADARRQRLQQVAAAVPCTEALLLLLEVVVLQLCLHQPSTETLLRMYDSTHLMISLLTESSPDTGAASPAAAAAAVALLQAVVQHLPPAVLHAAAVGGCKGLRSAAEEYLSVGEALHMQYARMVVQVPIFTSRRECQSAHHG